MLRADIREYLEAENAYKDVVLAPDVLPPACSSGCCAPPANPVGGDGAVAGSPPAFVGSEVVPPASSGRGGRGADRNLMGVDLAYLESIGATTGMVYGTHNPGRVPKSLKKLPFEPSGPCPGSFRR